MVRTHNWLLSSAILKTLSKQSPPAPGSCPPHPCWVNGGCWGLSQLLTSSLMNPTGHAAHSCLWCPRFSLLELCDRLRKGSAARVRSGCTDGHRVAGHLGKKGHGVSRGCWRWGEFRQSMAHWERGDGRQAFLFQAKELLVGSSCPFPKRQPLPLSGTFFFFFKKGEGWFLHFCSLLIAPRKAWLQKGM